MASVMDTRLGGVYVPRSATPTADPYIKTDMHCLAGAQHKEEPNQGC